MTTKLRLLGANYIKFNGFKQPALNFSDTAQHHHRSFFTITDLMSKKKELYKRELVGYSMEEMYSVVADVSNYHKFVPYVKKSLVHDKKMNTFQADLIVGFPPLNEEYTSIVTLTPPNHVRSVCNDGRLFNYLLNDWKFSSGLKDIQQSCVVEFSVCFEFKSLLHSRIATLFFDIICEQMENAFQQEAKKRFGPPSIRHHVLTSRRS